MDLLHLTNYLFLSNTTHAVNDYSDGAVGFGSILFPDISISPIPGFVSDAYLKYKVDQVDVKIGRKYGDMPEIYNIRTSLGVRYAQLKHDLTFAAPGNMISRYSGTGPLFSVDSHYKLGYGLSLVGYFDYALLAGITDTHSFVFLTPSNFNFVWPKRQRVVNNVTGRIGLDYGYVWNIGTTVNIEGGYQFNQYFDVFNTIRGTTAIASGIQRINGYETNNFSIQGPYLALTVHV